MSYLSQDFLDKYSGNPFENKMGEFVYLRTYSAWLEHKNRRETWKETIQRVVEYSLSLDATTRSLLEKTREAEKIFDLIYNLKIFPAGRTLWLGGRKASTKFPAGNFNCSGVVIDNFQSIVDSFYMLMIGSGVGFRILPEDVEQLPNIISNIKLEHDYFISIVPQKRNEYTIVQALSNRKYRITVGDSKEGWRDALSLYFTIHQYTGVETITINYDNIRGVGEPLKTFGGTASGHVALQTMFTNLHNVLSKKTKLLPIDCLDIMNIIAESVVVGGVRRSSELALFDENDIDVMKAKYDLWVDGTENSGKYWRSMSNNTIYFKKKPSIEKIKEIIELNKSNGEPGILNAQSANKSRPFFSTINPCGEAHLADKGVCNLTTVNLMAFIKDGEIDKAGLCDAIKQATRIGLRQTNCKMELPEWDRILKRDRLLGVSLTGIMDFIDQLQLPRDDFNKLLTLLKDCANTEATNYAREMKINRPLLVTLIKPEGTISQLPVVSSGLHRSFSPYYIRRIRITSHDPLAKVMLQLGYPIYPENGQGVSPERFDSLSYDEQREELDKVSTWVIEFPIKTTATSMAYRKSVV